MPFATRIVGIPKTWDNPNAPGWSIEDVWGPGAMQPLRGDPRLRHVVDETLYSDWIGAFTTDEALEQNSQWLKEWADHPEWLAREQRLQQLLEEHKRKQGAAVFVQVFEVDEGAEKLNPEA